MTLATLHAWTLLARRDYFALPEKHLLSLSLVLVLQACGGSGNAPSDISNSAGNAIGNSAAAEAIAKTGAGAIDPSTGQALATEGVAQNSPVGAPVTNTSAAAGVDVLGNPIKPAPILADQDQPTTKQDASRLLNQSGFGPTESLIADVAKKGARKYLLEQFAAPSSRYTYTLPDFSYRQSIHKHADKNQDFCKTLAASGINTDNCWRDYYTAEPATWEFFRHAVLNQDQLRQRVAFALGQIFVTSSKELEGAYGFAEYHQMLRDQSFGNLRTLLEKVTLSPLMGEYLNMVNNEGKDPNENYARELLQLFAIGVCQLNQDGSLQGGKCTATYDNVTVREYAYALSGWTYPVGGVNPWCLSGCNDWKNPSFFKGDMVAVAAKHDTAARKLLSNVQLNSGHTARQALDAVLDSIMLHPNTAPFIGKQLIQFLVTSNPSPAYVQRVSKAMTDGYFADAVGSIGSGKRGDMQATLAAILLDNEARDPTIAASPSFGKLREPVQYMAGAIRALNGVTDGERFGQYGWGSTSGQPVFGAPSVFNFYPPDFPLNGTSLQAPQFGIENLNTTLTRINFANELMFWWYNKGAGLAPNATIPNALGTKTVLSTWETLIVNPDTDSIKVIDRLNDLLVDGRMNSAEKQAILNAMNTWSSKDTWLTQANVGSNWQRERVKTAVYLILSSPQYQIQR